MKTSMRYSKKNWKRRLIIYGQRIAAIIGICAGISVFGVAGAVANGNSILYGVVGFMICFAAILASYALYQSLELALYWEHRTRIEKSKNITQRKELFASDEAGEEINQGAENISLLGWIE